MIFNAHPCLSVRKSGSDTFLRAAAALIAGRNISSSGLEDCFLNFGQCLSLSLR